MATRDTIPSTAPPSLTVGALARRLDQPVPIAPLVFFRVGFGALMAWEVLRYFSNGWIKRFWIDPGFHFKYFGFGWLEPWPGDGMYWHFGALGVLAVSIAIGFAYRAAAALFFLGFTYPFLLDQTTYLNHFYLICLLAGIAVFVSPHRAHSVAAARAPEWSRDTVPAWQLWLLRAQIGLVYGFAGIAKLNQDWLHGRPLGLWFAHGNAGAAQFGSWLDNGSAALAFSTGGLLFDLLIVPALLWPRTRWAAFAVAVAFHLTNAWLFSIGVFPWLMITMTALFLPAECFARAAARLRGSARVVAAAGSSEARPLRRTVLAALALYLGLQIAIPLRHWLYPGDVAWTEEGHRFAWRMKLRDKTGSARFYATDRDGTLLAMIDPGDHLNRIQVRTMAVRPDLILQFAHYLAADLERLGFAEFEIRARARVRLNDRPARELIDPSWNLAGAPRDLWPAPWIRRFDP
ncbi:MAG: HTTM domain-containing protein [Myxococcota bacterium]